MGRKCAAAATALLLLLSLAAGIARAGDPVAGMALFNNIPEAIISCGNSACHGPNPNDNVNGLQKAGNNAGVIEAAIRLNVQQMMFLNGLVNPIQLDDLAAYLAPQPELSSTAILFEPQHVGSGSTKVVTLRNLGGVDLALTDISLSGADASSYTLGGSCSVAAPLHSAVIDRGGGLCDVSVTFSPSAARSHQALLTLGYAGSTTFPAKQTIALLGAGVASPVPQIAIAPASLDFGEIVREAQAAPRTLTLTNTGTGPLLINALDRAGLHGAEFGLTGSCVDGIFNAPVQVAPSNNCTLVVSFSPQGLGARSASLTIRHNASGRASVVALAGTGVAATCQGPQPATEFRTLGCAAGQTGSITQSRSFTCSTVPVPAWIAGPWMTVADNCRSEQPGAPLELTEFYNATLDHYFVTADPAESAGIEAGLAGPGWTRTQVLGRVWDTMTPPSVAASVSTAVTGAVPGADAVEICRFYGNPATGSDGKRRGPNSHFYTADPVECAAVKTDPGWVFEGVVFRAVRVLEGQCNPLLRPVRRNYNLRFATNDSNHRYSTDPAIAAQMSARGWSDEGVVFCVEPK